MKQNKHIHDHNCDCQGILNTPTIDIAAIPLAQSCKTILILLEHGAQLTDELVVNEIEKLRSLLVDGQTMTVREALESIQNQIASLDTPCVATNEEIDNITN